MYTRSAKRKAKSIQKLLREQDVLLLQSKLRQTRNRISYNAVRKLSTEYRFKLKYHRQRNLFTTKALNGRAKQVLKRLSSSNVPNPDC